MKDQASDRPPGKSPGFWFYPHEFERDVQMLPLAAQGLWVRMLGWMHENEAHRGFLELPTGDPMTDIDIARKVGKDGRAVHVALEAMERIGTFSRDDRGCIYNRRMAREDHISKVRRAASQARRKMEVAATNPQGQIGRLNPTGYDESARPTQSNQNDGFPVRQTKSTKPNDFDGVKVPAKPQQNPAVSASDSVSDSDSDSSVGKRARSPAKPAALRSVSPVSERFEEWWLIWSKTRGTDKRLAAENAWFRNVSPDLEDAVFECTESYLESSCVADGGGYRPDNFLDAMAGERPAFSSRWPAYRTRVPVNGNGIHRIAPKQDNLAERTIARMQQNIANGGKPF